VMLIGPNYICPPLHAKPAMVPVGISYLAAVLRQNYEVRLMDSIVEGYAYERVTEDGLLVYGLTEEMILKEIENFGPQVVGVGCTFSGMFTLMSSLVQKIKQTFPEIITVTGGPHTSFLPEDTFHRTPGLDYIILGEGEESFPRLLEAIQKGKGIEEIDGLAWKDNGSIRVNPKTKFIADLDTIPFPARDLLPMEKYFKINVPFLFYSKNPRNLSFITSRGCPFKCRFCSSANHWGRRIRFRSVENVLAEMGELVNRFGVKELKFEDDNLMANPSRAKAIFRGMIERKFNLKWNMPNGVMIKALDDDELLHLMKESGCYEVILAFESGSQYVLDNIIHKPVDLAKAPDITRKVRDHGIDTLAFFIVGFPGETKEMIRQTVNYAKNLPLDKIFLWRFNPLPGTELYEESLAKGLFKQEDLYRENYVLTGIQIEGMEDRLYWKYFQEAYSASIIKSFLRAPIRFIKRYYKSFFKLESYRAIWRMRKAL